MVNFIVFLAIQLFNSKRSEEAKKILKTIKYGIIYDAIKHCGK